MKSADQKPLSQDEGTRTALRTDCGDDDGRGERAAIAVASGSWLTWLYIYIYRYLLYEFLSIFVL